MRRAAGPRMTSSCARADRPGVTVAIVTGSRLDRWAFHIFPAPIGVTVRTRSTVAASRPAPSAEPRPVGVSLTALGICTCAIEPEDRPEPFAPEASRSEACYKLVLITRSLDVAGCE